MKKENNYWLTKKASSYDSFNIALPSEIIAYHISYEVLNPKGKKILDFGCFQGNSSNNILNKGAKQVTGIDISNNNIRIAKAKYKDKKQLNFKHIPNNTTIAKEEYDACSMTFVHPVIKSKENLSLQFKKINQALKKDGKLIIMGLNPKAFNEKFNFLHYNFNKKIPINPKDELQFQNTLFLPSNEKLHLIDTFWSDEKMTNLLKDNNFKVKSIDLNNKSLNNNLKKSFKRIKEEVRNKYSLTWGDEWTAPLYKIFIATKK